MKQEKEVKNEYLKKILDIDKKHLQKYGKRKMTLEELDTVCEKRF